MEINKIDREGTIRPDGTLRLTRPIPERECKCGCGYSFYPKRNDQVYLNKQHADYGYNHGTRKTKNYNQIKIDKILSNNDKVLEKHFKTKGIQEVECYLDILKADGFNSSYHIGSFEKDNIVYYYSYNFYFHIYLVNKIKMIKIFKQ